MKHVSTFLLPPVLALLGVAVCCVLLWNQAARFKRSVETIAEGVRVSLIGLDGKVVYDSAGQDLPNHADGRVKTKRRRKVHACAVVGRW